MSTVVLSRKPASRRCPHVLTVIASFLYCCIVLEGNPSCFDALGVRCETLQEQCGDDWVKCKCGATCKVCNLSAGASGDPKHHGSPHIHEDDRGPPCASWNLTGTWQEVHPASAAGSTLSVVHRPSLDAQVVVLPADRNAGPSIGVLRISNARCALFVHGFGTARIIDRDRIEWNQQGSWRWTRTSEVTPGDDSFDVAALTARSLLAYVTRIGDKVNKTILAVSSCRGDSDVHANIMESFNAAGWHGLYVSAFGEPTRLPTKVSNNSHAYTTYPCSQAGSLSLRLSSRHTHLVHQSLREQCLSVPPLQVRSDYSKMLCAPLLHMVTWIRAQNGNMPIAVLWLDVGQFDLPAVLESVPSLANRVMAVVLRREAITTMTDNVLVNSGIFHLQ